MAAPVWTTPQGNLGTIVEGKFYQLQLNADNALSFAFHSGELPSGVVVKSSGTLEGYPSNQDYVQGVPSQVDKDTISKFSIRATSVDGLVTDRVFSLTVTGPDAPIIDTLPPAELGTYFDGEILDLQLTATDADPNPVLTWKITAGDFPEGLTLSSTGKIGGYIQPMAGNTGTPGFDITNFDTTGYDFNTTSISKTYTFTVQVSDGFTVDQKKYTLNVISRNLATADATEFTVDAYAPTSPVSSINSRLTADQTNRRSPVMITESQNLGTVKHNNFFSFKFDAIDTDNDNIVFEIGADTAEGYDGPSGYDMVGFDGGDYNIPVGVTLDPTSGWFTGHLPNIAARTEEYTWAIRVVKKNNSEYASAWNLFTLTVEGDIDKTLTWPNEDLGTIQTGEISELNVQATTASGASLIYELKSGKAQKLPQGIRLDSNGLLIGRVSFETFMLDTGLTTFDINNLFYNETIWDRTYEFTVRAYTTDLTIDTFKKFKIQVRPSSLKPYESLYVRALPTQDQRDIFASLMQNSDDIPPEDLYRPTDFNFGIQQDIRMLIASGLNPKKLTDYVQAMSQNHYNNILRFNKFKTARALDSSGNVKYELIYVEVVDKGMGIDITTGSYEPASQSVDLRSSINWSNPLTVDAGNDYSISVDSGNFSASAGNNYKAYPNALQNMRTRLKNKIGEAVLERLVLPDWMKDEQEDNSILNWQLAVPLVYCKPGTSEKIKYRLEQRTNLDLKKISFEVDRYIVDNNLSKHYDKTTGKYSVSAETTFDINKVETVFDGNGTEFFANVDKYVYLDEEDKYIKFPQTGVFR